MSLKMGLKLEKGIFFALLIYLLAEEFGGWGGRLLLLSSFFLLRALFLVFFQAPRSARWLAIGPGALISIGSQIKHRYLDYPLYFWDLKFLLGRDQWDVLNHYAGRTGAVLLVCILIGGLGVGTWTVLRERRRYRWMNLAEGRGLWGSGTRSLGWQLVIGLMMVGGSWGWLMREARTWVHPDLMGFRHPFAVFWVSSLSTRIELVPSPREEHRPVDGEQALAPVISRGEVPRVKPNLIMILQESAMDPRILSAHWSQETRWNPMVEAGALHGPLQVHVFGGGTWCSEFTSLVGLPTSSLGLLGGYATYLLEGKVNHSLVSSLKYQGYRTISLYPGPGEFVNGGPFHRKLGFDAFRDFHDRKGFGRSYWSLTDREVYETALEQMADHFQKHPEQPLFTWVKTIRNHGPHGLDCSGRDFSRVDSLLEAGGFSPLEHCDLRDYLDRYQQAVEGYAWFRSELAKRFPQRSFSIAQFGDHQPASTEGLQDSAGNPVLKPWEKLQTYFAIDRIGGKAAPYSERFQSLQKALGSQGLDLAYLGAYWLESVGLPLTKVEQLRLQTARVCRGAYPQDEASPGATVDCLDAVSILHGEMKLQGNFKF